MKTASIENVSRRRFIKAGLTAGAGLTLGVYLPSLEADAGPGKAGSLKTDAVGLQPNAFVRIDVQGNVTVVSKHLEMGQGAYTGMATLVAEELDADWAQVRVVGAPADASRYNNLFWGPAQGTGGSTAIANSFQQMRKAGAAARAMLVTAAARQWGVDENDVTVTAGRLNDSAGHEAGFGDLAETAARLPVPEEVLLKDPAEFTLIGREDLPRKDMADKVNGRAIYTQDIRLPGMLTALVAHPPRFGARVHKFDESSSLAVAGVEKVVQIDAGVAVLARDFWSAKKGRDALVVEWDESDAFTSSSADMETHYRSLAADRGMPARDAGHVQRAFESADKVLENEYVFPYLAHAAMEPMNCVCQVSDDGVEIWNGAQLHTGDQHVVAALAGVDPANVRINTLYAGGSFGRRANPASDYVVEAVSIALAAKTDQPVKLVWTREDDMRAGWYRPMFVHRLKAALDKQGNPLAWEHRLVGQSIVKDTVFESALLKDGIDQVSVEGSIDLPYDIPHHHVSLHSPVQSVPVQWWRAVGSTHTAFSVETMIDELAAAAGEDPLIFRRQLMHARPREKAVMELAALKAGWEKPLGKGRGRGIAVHKSFNSFVAQVAEVSVNGKEFSVDRVVIAVDCGIAVNPDVVRAQMEGGMGFGLSAALGDRISLTNGQVDQSNFHDYPVLRISRMPEVEVHIVASAEQPTGVGEPATPVIAPAVANALAAATGQRLHRLPLRLV